MNKQHPTLCINVIKFDGKLALMTFEKQKECYLWHGDWTDASGRSWQAGWNVPWETGHGGRQAARVSRHRLCQPCQVLLSVNLTLITVRD